MMATSVSSALLTSSNLIVRTPAAAGSWKEPLGVPCCIGGVRSRPQTRRSFRVIAKSKKHSKESAADARDPVTKVVDETVVKGLGFKQQRVGDRDSRAEEGLTEEAKEVLKSGGLQDAAATKKDGKRLQVSESAVSMAPGTVSRAPDSGPRSSGSSSKTAVQASGKSDVASSTPTSWPSSPSMATKQRAQSAESEAPEAQLTSEFSVKEEFKMPEPAEKETFPKAEIPLANPPPGGWLLDRMQSKQESQVGGSSSSTSAQLQEQEEEQPTQALPAPEETLKLPETGSAHPQEFKALEQSSEAPKGYSARQERREEPTGERELEEDGRPFKEPSKKVQSFDLPPAQPSKDLRYAARDLVIAFLVVLIGINATPYFTPFYNSLFTPVLRLIGTVVTGRFILFELLPSESREAVFNAVGKVYHDITGQDD